MLPEYFFVFDVESIGLYGEGFAAGIVIAEATTGNVVDEWLISCDPINAVGGREDYDWVTNNVTVDAPAGFSDTNLRTFKSPAQVRRCFWTIWELWRRNSVMVADCTFPVESNFLSRCVLEIATGSPMSESPYPVLDLASVLLTHGRDPVGEYLRLPSELPKHNPLCDARQTARLFKELVIDAHLGD